ncbi:MAG: sugar ABC transporter substrate-binding protein, partial [Clostridiaceae bacterium]|nr:sugar ABC transporter substrate-binding protein [Clostridiaceae bacterium]
MKKFLSVLLCATLLVSLLLSGCGQQKETTGIDNATTSTPTKVEEPSAPNEEKKTGPLGERPADGWTFGYTCMDGTNPFFVILEKTIRDGVEARGDKLITTDPANDVTLQITQIEDMITQGIDAIFLNPAEAEGILPALDMLKDAGIPILNFDTEVAELSYAFSYVGSDNYNAGYVCGLDLVEKVPGGGKIIILDSP